MSESFLKNPLSLFDVRGNTAIATGAVAAKTLSAAGANVVFIGTIIFFILRQTMSGLGALYLLMLGLVAIAIMLKAPKGLWGYVADRYGWQLFPLARHVVFTDAAAKQ